MPIMMTDKTCSNKLLKDLNSIPSPIFYIFAAVAVFCALFVHGFTPQGYMTTIFLLLLVACASADIKDGIVPDLILIFIAILAVLNFFVIEKWSMGGAIDHLLGAIVISIPMLILALSIKKAFGGGDIKLMAAAGLYLGLRPVIAAAVLGMFLAGVYSFYIIIWGKKGRKALIRLAPFLVYGLAIISLFMNDWLI